MYYPPINIFLPITSIFQQKRVFRTEGVSFFVFFREYWTRHGGGVVLFRAFLYVIDSHRESDTAKQKRRFGILKRRFCAPKSHL